MLIDLNTFFMDLALYESSDFYVFNLIQMCFGLTSKWLVEIDKSGFLSIISENFFFPWRHTMKFVKIT